jgi:hypothetical protein
LSWSKIFKWHHRFKDDHELLENDPHSRWLAASWNKDSVRQLQETVCCNLHKAVETIAEKKFWLVVAEKART